MTEKEKAKQLFNKFYFICQEYTEEIQCSIQAKQCALICVDEILLAGKQKIVAEYFDDIYWIKIKKEIEKL